MGRRAILLIVAVFVAAAGTTLVLLYVQGIDARATAEQQPVRVLTATAVIESGETLATAQAAGKLDLAEWPSSKVLPNAVSSTQGMQDQVAVTAILPGEQIITDKFGAVDDQEVIDIPNGKMAISVQLSDPARVAGFVRPGAQVAIFLTGQPELVEPGGETRSLPQISKLLLRKVEVIGVGDTTVLSTTTTTSSGQETTEEIPKTILTLAVNQDEAERLFVGSHGGDLAFALLNEKSVTQNSAGTTLNDIFVD